MINDYDGDDDDENDPHAPPPFLSVETAVQQGGRSVEEPRLKLDEFPGGHGTSTISSGCFCSKAMVCLVENLQKTAIEIIGK